MRTELTYLAVSLGLLAGPPALVLWALRRRARVEPRLAVLCEAIGGPCDGRTWYLPELAPIWLRYGDQRHLYRPVGPGGHGADYSYAGVSEPCVSGCAEGCTCGRVRYAGSGTAAGRLIRRHR